MFLGSKTKPCRNGPDCYYLKRDRCFFYHPPSHYRHGSYSRTSYRPQANNVNTTLRLTGYNSHHNSFETLLSRLLKV